MAFPKIGGVDPRVPGQNQMNSSAEIDDWSGKAEERLAEKELHRFSASLFHFHARNFVVLVPAMCATYN